MFDFKRIIYTRKNLHVIPEKLPGYNFVFQKHMIYPGPGESANYRLKYMVYKYRSQCHEVQII